MTSPFWGLDDDRGLWGLEEEDDPTPQTAMGRLRMESEGRQKQLETYRKALQQPDITPERKAMLERVIGNLERPVEADKPGGRGLFNRIERSVTKGALQGAAAFSELPLKIVELGQRLLPGEFQPTGKVREMRRGIQETQALIEEQYPTDPGVGDIVGRLAGGIVGAGPMWAQMARSTGQAALAILPQGHKLAQAIRAAESGSVGQRIVGQELINIPLDALDAIDQLDATTKERLLALGIAVGGTAFGAAIQRPRGPGQVTTAPTAPGPASPVDLRTAAATTGTPDAGTLVELRAAAQAADAAEQLKRATSAARKEFKKLYPELKWAELPEEQKQAWIEASKVPGLPKPSMEAGTSAKPMTSEEAAESLADIAEETGQLKSMDATTVARGQQATPPKPVDRVDSPRKPSVEIEPPGKTLAQLATEAEEMAVKAKRVAEAAEDQVARMSGQAPPNRVPEGYLHTVPLQKQLKDHSLEELGQLKTAAQKILTEHPNDAVTVKVQSDLLDIAMAERKLGKGVKKVVSSTYDPSDPRFKPREVTGEQRAAAQTVPDPETHVPKPAANPERTYNANELRSFYVASLRKLSPDELAAHRMDIESRIDATLDPMPYQKRLDAVLAEIAERERPRRDGGVVAQSPPEIGGAILGGFLGSQTGENPEDRTRNALIGAAIGVGGVAGARTLSTKLFKSTSAKPRPAFPGEEPLNDLVVTHDELAHGKKAYKPFASERERQIEGVMRPGFMAQKATRLAGGRNLGWAMNVGKQSVEGSDAFNAALPFVIGTPYIHKLNGQYVHLSDVTNLQDILKTVDGDVKGLGNVATALTVLEKSSLPGARPEPKLSPMQALRYLENVPQSYIDAAKKMRQLYSTLLEQAVELEMVSRAAADKMLQEQNYTAIQRVFDDVLVRSAEQVDMKQSGLVSSQPVQARKGTRREYQILNPVENLERNITRYMWAFAEQRRKLTMLATRDAERAALKATGRNPDDAALARLIRRVPGVKAKNTERYRAHVQRIAQELNLREAEAEQVFDNFNPKPVSTAGDDPRFSVWRDGVRETYAIDKDLAETFRLPSREAEAFWFQALEALTKGVRFGVTRDPFFALRMAIIDNWQAYLASNYGFRFGLDHMAGFLASMGAEKIASRLSGVDVPEAMKGYVLKRPAHLLSETFKTDDPTRLVKIAANKEATSLASLKRATKELKWGQAYNILLSNIAESGRMGLYLAAIRKGASIDDAIYEATTAIGNYQTRGKRLEKLARVALFLNPAVKAFDAELNAMGVGPGSRSYRETGQGLRVRTVGGLPVDGGRALKYFSKGFAGITIPTIALYALNQDDPDIERLRKTDAGLRYNFIRVGDQIYRMRKPFTSGQIFGTAIEAAMDNYKANDPVGFSKWLGTMLEDLPLNVLPTGLGVAGSVAMDRDLMSGMPIAGQSLGNRTPAERDREGTSLPAKMLGQALGPMSEMQHIPEFLRTVMSPVGIDYITRALGGTLAAEALQGVTMAHEWSQQNYLRPASEMPIVRSIFANTNSVSAQSVEQFYALVDRVDETMNTISYLSNDPVRLAKFFERNREFVAIAEPIREVRNEIIQMRQSLEDIRTAPNEIVSKAAKVKYRNAINRAIVQRIEFLMNTINPAMRDMQARTR